MSSNYARGCLPRVTIPGEHPRLKVMGTDGTPEPVDPREPDVIDPDLYVKAIINQGNQGSCCGCAGVDGMMASRAMQGLPHILLSQASLYGRGNGGRDQGMAIDTCLQLLMEDGGGACPADLIDPMDWRGFWAGTWPENWRTVAAGFRVLEAYDCQTVEHVRACYKRGFPVIYGAEGHAVVRIGDDLDINSWGKSWGYNGLGRWVSESTIARQIGMYGAWGLRVAIDA
jgi:hypothetical protein